MDLDLSIMNEIPLFIEEAVRVVGEGLRAI
jgi:hypothetical protein